jgi:urease accessory protein
MTQDPLALVRLLQLASPALPIGAYSYSQGLEWAVEAGDIRDAASAQAWIGDLLRDVMSVAEAPVLCRLCDAAATVDWASFAHWNAWFRASRETAELQAETLQMGGSLWKLLVDLDVVEPATRNAVQQCSPLTLPAAYALAAAGLGVRTDEAAIAYLWSWLENQVLAALKAVPLGQVAGQRMLLALAAQVPGAVASARALADDDIANFAPGFALASARHETQYTRIFRS